MAKPQNKLSAKSSAPPKGKDGQLLSIKTHPSIMANAARSTTPQVGASDTLTIAEEMREAGFTSKQSPALARRFDSLASKEDLRLVREDLQREIQNLRDEITRELQRYATKEDLAMLELRLNDKMFKYFVALGGLTVASITIATTILALILKFG